MRILIVGGGIAGLTLAALLRQRGIHPQVVEKSQGYGGTGYVLTLWPVGSRILKGLGLYEPFYARSQPLRHYAACDEGGRVLRPFDFTAISARYGPVLGVRRSDLIDILRHGCGDLPIRLGTTITSLQPEGDAVRATFADHTTQTFDLVVGCDGIHSRTRELVFGDVPLTYVGWTGWAWWLDPSLSNPETITEYWSAGRFLGLYPAKEALCCFCALPVPQHAPDPAEGRPTKLRRGFKGLGGLAPKALEQLPPGEQIWHDDFCDVWMPTWARGRVLLIGDAGAAILPTAGIGASMAMESAAALADELSRADAASVDLAVRLFVKRRRRRVDAVQAVSRRLARFTLLKSRILTYLRNKIVPFLNERLLLGGLVRMQEEPF